MTKTEELMDILHREEMKKLNKEIDELPDLYGELNCAINKECINLSSPDLLIGNPLFRKPMNKTDWRDKYEKPKTDLNIINGKQETLQSIIYLYYIAGLIQLGFCIGLFWLMASSGKV